MNHRHADFQSAALLTSQYAIAALQLLIFTGARLGEILTLQWEFVDLDRALIFLPDSKTGKKSLFLSAPALNILDQLPRTDGNPYVICGSKKDSPLINLRKPWVRIRDRATLKLWSLVERLSPLFSKLENMGSPITRSSIEVEAEKQGIPLNNGLTDVRIHDLRHSFASFGASGGLPLHILGKLLGHTQSVTTARYAHLADDPVRAVNEAIGAKILAAMAGGSKKVSSQKT